MPKQHSQKMDRRKKRTSTKQYMMYIEMMEKDPIFATGRIPGNCNVNYLIIKWKELSDELNNCNNGPILTSDEWRKRLNDWKNTTRSKYRRSISMSTLEIRALDLFGKGPPLQISKRFKSKKGEDEEVEMEAIDYDEAEQHIVELEHDQHEDISPDNTYFRSTLSSANADQIIYYANKQQLNPNSTMDICILCLEIKKDVLDSIKVNSLQWQELNIENLIEQHLWPMETATISSYLCSTCWQELNDFHKFYLRIEEAQKSIVVKIEIEPAETSIQETYSQDSTIEEDMISRELEECLSEADKPLIQLDKINQVSIVTNSADENEPAESSMNEKLSKDLTIGHDIISRELDDYISEEDTHLCQVSTTTNSADEFTIGDPLNLPKKLEILKPFIGEVSDNEDSDIDLNFEPDAKRKNKSCSKITDEGYNKKTDSFIAENFKITCSICQISFETFFDLCKHFTKEHKQPGYVLCCGKKFFKRRFLLEHVHQHVDPNYLKCNICGKELSNRICLKFHIQTHGPREKNYCCDICGISFIKLCALTNHKTIHLSEEEKPFPCLDCGKNFGNKVTLASHISNVHVSVSCDICGKVLSNKSVLNRHKLIVHPEGESEKYTCSICLKTFRNKHGHRTHQKVVHHTNHDYECTMCDKAYKNSRKLKDHMATHTNTYLYNCSYCPKKFMTIDTMQAHRRNLHLREWQEEKHNNKRKSTVYNK